MDDLTKRSNDILDMANQRLGSYPPNIGEQEEPQSFAERAAAIVPKILLGAAPIIGRRRGPAGSITAAAPLPAAGDALSSQIQQLQAAANLGYQDRSALGQQYVDPIQLNKRIDALKNMQRQLQPAESAPMIEGYCHGGKVRGMARGGKIKGPGTATSDSIPAKVKETGEPIQVSNGERILSARQDALLQRIAGMLGYDTVDAMLEAGTGQPVGPTIKGGKKAAATGMAPGYTDEQGNYHPASALTGPARPSGQPSTDTPDSSPSPMVINGVRYQDKPVIQGPLTALSSGYGAVANKLAGAAGLDIDKRIEENRAASRAGQSAEEATPEAPAAGPATSSTVQQAAASAGEAPAKPDAAAAKSYVDTEGNPTDDWSKTAEYQRGLGDAANLRHQLTNLRRLRLESDATDPTITDPKVREEAQKGLLLLGQAQAQTDKSGLDQVMLDQAKQVEALRRRLIDPRTPPEEQKRLAALIATTAGHGEKEGGLQIHDVEVPIDPAKPLLGNRKVPYLVDRRTGASRPMLQGSQQPDQDIVSQARAAIARGANRDAVNARLRQMGLPEVK